MIWLRRRASRTPRPIDPRRAELQTPKDILAEIFRVRACEVEKMIRRKNVEERALSEGGMWPERLWMEE